MNGETQILSEPAYATALYGENQIDSFNITFLNQGDAPYHRREEAEEAIEAAAERLEMTLRQRLENLNGLHWSRRPTRKSLALGLESSALLLSHMEGKFVTLRIMPSNVPSAEVEKIN